MRYLKLKTTQTVSDTICVFKSFLRWTFLLAVTLSSFSLVSCEREDMYTFGEHRLAIGDTGPGGGIVFYVTDGGMHGLEAAPVSTEWTANEWGSYGTLIGGTVTSVGSGMKDSEIVAAWLNANGEADRASQVCLALEYGNYSDWYLPSKDELNLIYVNLKLNGLGDFADNFYWSSSEETLYAAWGQDFTSGSQYGETKDWITASIRAVRSF